MKPAFSKFQFWHKPGNRRTYGIPVTTLSILGSTGSIGKQALEIVDLFPDQFRIHGLAAGSNWKELAAQALKFRPRAVYLSDASHRALLVRELEGTGIEVATNPEALSAMASDESVTIVLAAMVGFVGLPPVLSAVGAGKRVALANKETLVVGGRLVTDLARKTGAEILPVDSEHSAIFQCLVGEPADAVESITLTASGGPFRTWSADRFDAITPREALRHPNWSMGAKITIDSATLMNKGLEVIEAHWVFGIPGDRIHVLVHPQSIIHSIVTFTDGSSKAQMGPPDMRVPIQYALSYPDRWPAPHPRLDWTALHAFDFEMPDRVRFPCLGLAYDALEAGGSAPVALNAANEEAVARFLSGSIRFTDIPRLVSEALERLSNLRADSLEDLIEVDREARQLARTELIRS